MSLNGASHTRKPKSKERQQCHGKLVKTIKNKMWSILNLSREQREMELRTCSSSTEQVGWLVPLQEYFSSQKRIFFFMEPHHSFYVSHSYRRLPSKLQSKWSSKSQTLKGPRPKFFFAPAGFGEEKSKSHEAGE